MSGRKTEPSIVPACEQAIRFVFYFSGPVYCGDYVFLRKIPAKPQNNVRKLSSIAYLQIDFYKKGCKRLFRGYKRKANRKNKEPAFLVTGVHFEYTIFKV